MGDTCQQFPTGTLPMSKLPRADGPPSTGLPGHIPGHIPAKPSDIGFFKFERGFQANALGFTALISKRHLQQGSQLHLKRSGDPAAYRRGWCNKCKTYAAKNRKRNQNYHPVGKLQVDQFILPRICEAASPGGTSTFLTPNRLPPTHGPLRRH